MPGTDQGHVSLNISESGIATISFYHPAQNSLPAGLLQELTNQIISAGNNSQTRVIVLKSEGDRTFCAGASFDELLQIKDKQAGAIFFSGFAQVINCLP
jgi:methylglutaconyl-CoA hydratase